MATELADIANNAGLKIGGYGDQIDGSGQVTTASLTANDDLISKAVNTAYPIIRKRVIKQFAALQCPFLETQKFADLGDELKKDDVVIESLSVTGGVVTFVTAEAHDLSVSDTRFLSDLQGTLVTALNGTTEEVATVPSTTTFTLTGVTGTDSWDYTENSGCISKAPETGAWRLAFNLPSDFFVIVRQTDEVGSYKDDTRRRYQNQQILNRDGDGLLLLSNNFTNLNRDSAYIEYCIDQTTFALLTSEFEECLAMLLAAELSPMVGRDTEFRQRLLVEYKELTVPAAQAAIQSQIDNYSRDLPDYKGGRANVLGTRMGIRNIPPGGYTAV